ncbi:hypothetical protein [Thiolapillus sp.]
MIVEVPFYWVDKYPDRGGATGDYQPSLRSPWLAAMEPIAMVEYIIRC